MRQNILDGNFWFFLPPPSPLSINFFAFANGKFLKHSTEGFSYELFWHCETRNCWRKNLITPPPPLIHTPFRYRKFLKHSTKEFTYKMFQQCETTNFRRKILILPPPSYPNFFGTRNQCNSKGFPYGKLLALWDKKFSTENLDTAPLLFSINFFAAGNFLKRSTGGFPYEVFRYCETKKFRQRIVT